MSIAKQQPSTNHFFLQKINYQQPNIFLAKKHSSSIGLNDKQQISTYKSTMTKRQQLRFEIRKNFNLQTMANQRKKLLQSLQSLQFFYKYQYNQNKLTPSQINNLLDLLQSKKNDAEFFFKLKQLELQKKLYMTIQQPQLSLQQKMTMLASMVQLSYYCSESAINLGQQKLLDFFMNQMKKFDVKSSMHIEYFFLIVSLMENITACCSNQFHHYVSESSFNVILRDKISESKFVNFEQTYKFLKASIQFYTNMINKRHYNKCFTFQALQTVFYDLRFLENHLQELIEFLRQLIRTFFSDKKFKNEKNHKQMMSSLLIDAIQKIMNNLIDDDLINELVQLFNQFFDSSRSDFQKLIALQIFQIHQITITMIKRYNLKKSVTNFLGFFNRVLDIPGVSLMGNLRNNRQELYNDTLKVITDKSKLKHTINSAYCFRILQVLVKQDENMFKKIIEEYQILDVLYDVFHLEYSQFVVEAGLTLLATILWRQLNQVEGKQRKVGKYAKFLRLDIKIEEKGIQKCFQDLQQIQNQDVQRQLVACKEILWKINEHWRSIQLNY